MNISRSTTLFDKEKSKKYFAYVASIGLGFLALLSCGQLSHFVEDGGNTFSHLLIAGVVLGVGVVVGRILATHLSVCTHEHTDDVDVTFIALLVVGSLVHTIFDGSVIHEAFVSGVSQGAGVLGAILLHEVVRTSILYQVIRVMGFKKISAFFSVFGVSLLGILGGYALGGFIAGYQQYEGIAHLISGGMFIAVTTDLYFYVKHHFGKVHLVSLVAGVLLAILLG